MEEGAQHRVAAYQRHAALAPRVSHDDAALLAERAHHGDADAEQDLVRANRRLVVSMARKYVVASPHEDEWETRATAQSPDTEHLAALLLKGEEGLQTAVHRFDRSKGFSFAAYATWWIRKAMIEGTQGGGSVGVREPRPPAPVPPTRAASLGSRHRYLT